MDMNLSLKCFSSLINIFIIVIILRYGVNSMPPVATPFEEKNTQNNDVLSLFINQFKRVLSVSSVGLQNHQKIKGFDIIEEVREHTFKSIFDRLQNLFTLPFEHHEIQEQQIQTDSGSNRGNCQAPDSCLKKKQGDNLCTVCEDDMAAATDLINYFQESRSENELLNMAEKCKNNLNEYLLNYALTNVLATKFPDLEYPSIIEVFPGLFINKHKFYNIKKEVAMKHRHKRMDEETVHVTPVFYTHYDDPELSLNYFREDYGYNSHHWNWHILHRVAARIDRRGELFWYMHKQMLSRYDLERLSVGLDRVKSSGPLNQTLDTGYFPNLDPTTNGNDWASRQDNTLPKSFEINGNIYNISKAEEWHKRLSQAAKDGFMIDEHNETVLLSDDVDITSGARRGIDIFTGAAEADPRITPNREFYGNLHNFGHNIISHMHDPDNRHQLGTIGVMANAAVSARDPAFYMWHKYFDDLIQEYKRTQKPYAHQRLELANIYLNYVQVDVDVNIAWYKTQSSPIPETIDEEILGGAKNNVSQPELPTETIDAEILGGAKNNASQPELPTETIDAEILGGAKNNASQPELPTEIIDAEILDGAKISISQPELPTETIYAEILGGAKNNVSQPELPTETIDAEILSGAKNNVNQPELLTGCNTYGIDISRGIDFSYFEKNVVIELTHLDHVPFHYYISVLNARYESKNVTIRIFLAPKYDMYGQAMPLHEQKHLFILLDKFEYLLSPGPNMIHRLSTESSVTSKCRNSTRDSTARSYSHRGVFGGGHCGCGWPHHLLLPRGSLLGMVFQLFVILTDWDHDFIPTENVVSSLCGVLGDKYPDWQPMGYPFDRPFNESINFIDQLAESLINAHVSDVPIRFTGRHVITQKSIC